MGHPFLGENLLTTGENLRRPSAPNRRLFWTRGCLLENHVIFTVNVAVFLIEMVASITIRPFILEKDHMSVGNVGNFLPTGVIS